jgi:hypothetical protein
MLHAPEAVVLDEQDNLYVSDTMNHRVRRVDAATGIITTVAGNGDSGYEDKNMGRRRRPEDSNTATGF